MGFTPSRSDSSLFTYIRPNLKLYFLVYEDDIVLTGSVSLAVQQLINTLSGDFPLKNLGRQYYFLGVEVYHLPTELLLSQKKYILDFFKKTNMSTAKPVQTPMPTSAPLNALDGVAFEDSTLYRSVISSLQYLAFTRPDLSFAVNRVCQHVHLPRVPHWQVVKRILRYLQHIVDFGLQITKSAHSVLVAYFDVDRAGCPDDRRSTGGLCVFLSPNLISWSSQKQTTIAPEAEYKAVANATCELLWIQSLLRDLGIFYLFPSDSLVRQPWCHISHIKPVPAHSHQTCCCRLPLCA